MILDLLAQLVERCTGLRGRGFKSRTGLNFFQVLFSTTRFSSVLSCEGLLMSSLHRGKYKHKYKYMYKIL